jgi:hypothetical protein
MRFVTGLTKLLGVIADRARTCVADRRSSFALEFAMIAPIFLLLLFVVFEVSYDEFMQEVLDNAVSSAARQVQVGNAISAKSSNFVAKYLCPYDGGMLNCNNLFVRIEQVTFTQGSCSNVGVNVIGDFYDATQGGLPVSNGVVQLGGYFNGGGSEGTGSKINQSPCGTTSSNSGYCNAGAQQYILMSAVYLAPSFLGGLILNHTLYNNKIVHAQFATAAFETETFTSTPANPQC